MAPRRTYTSCAKCGGNSMGKYKDSDGNDLCRRCAPSSAIKGRPRLHVCTECGHGHYDEKGDGMCSTCRVKKNRKLNTVKRCITCDTYIRSSLDTVTECINCMGEAKYCRLRRANKREQAIN